MPNGLADPLRIGLAAAAVPATVSGEFLLGPLGACFREGAGYDDPRARRPAFVFAAMAAGRDDPAAGDEVLFNHAFASPLRHRTGMTRS